jgi:hypothetical protein
MSEENTMAMSSEIGKLAEALAKAQMEIKGAIKECKNPFFNSRYADLATVWDACREPLSKQGLAVIQTTDGTPDQMVILTTLAHSSGQWIRGRLVIKPIASRVSKDDPRLEITPQTIGSCLTYGRRYALAAIVGVAPEDDDGNSASGKQPVEFRKQSTPVVDQMLKTGQALKVPPVQKSEPVPEIQKESIPKGLNTLMELTGVRLEELKVYLEGKNFIPKAGKISDLKKHVLDQMTEDGNWDKVVNKIKVARIAKATAA